MSGIFGIIHRDGRPVEAAELERMRDAMAHRGPDGSRIWMDGAAGLGQLMLCSTPESLHETLPWHDPESGLVITADARIDNREELAKKLGIRSRRPQSGPPQDFLEGPAGGRSAGDRLVKTEGANQPPIPDSQFILEAYKRWGEACVDHLLGDFAFVIWDASRQRLFCARDQVGAAPLFYVCRRAYFAFASEEEALLCLPGVSSMPDPALIAKLLVPQYPFAGKHGWGFADVDALMPAHSLLLHEGNLQICRYWSVVAPEVRTEVSDQEAEERFLNVLSEAVRCRMRTSGGVALMLSGGLDSAGIAATMQRLLPESGMQTFRTYSAVDDKVDACIESQSILAMIKSFDVDPKVLSVPSFTGMLDVQDLLDEAWSKAHPVVNSILLPAMMCRAAGLAGERVMLHGASGDITLDIPSLFPAMIAKEGLWWRALQECVAAGQNNIYQLGASPAWELARNAWFAYAPAWLKKPVRRLRHRSDEHSFAGSLINPDFARRMRIGDRIKAHRAEREIFSVSELREAQADALAHGIRLPLAAAGRAAARHGVEARDPWTDTRVIQCMLSLPMSCRVRDGWTKYLVRHVFRHAVPGEVLWRRDKRHLGWLFTRRLMQESAHRVSGIMENQLSVAEAYIDMDKAYAVFKHYREQGDSESREAIYGLVSMIGWLQRTGTLCYGHRGHAN